jgi:hypothetical protein
MKNKKVSTVCSVVIEQRSGVSKKKNQEKADGSDDDLPTVTEAIFGWKAGTEGTHSISHPGLYHTLTCGNSNS